MASITLKGSPCSTSGELPAIGTQAPEILLVDGELNDVNLATYAGKKKLLNIVPSLDTATCAISTKKFNEHAVNHKDTVILIVSADLPFAQQRFCNDEKLSNVVPLAMMRSRDFAKDYGVLINDGPLAGVTARAVVVIDENDKVIYTQLVPEIVDEPDYESALKSLG
ncbi:MAG: thiol peroxidase [Gammaproteobacteria bacterium]|nr:thiol peroxidase [Gammaproteobacteria bacterium]